jgi:hypothetical protein
MPPIKNLSGKNFKRLTAQWPEGFKRRVVVWLCVCECGNLTRVDTQHFGRTQSCGCRQAETRDQTSHGQATGGRVTSELLAYYSAKRRCTNSADPAYPFYGGRGIQFKFSSFKEFFAELGTKPGREHSIDRISNGGHYEPGNVRWATKKEQALNRRARSPHKRGKYKCQKPCLPHLPKTSNCPPPE